jgi:pimeloyl-ACP methyl ester carboxylesterase
MASQGVARAQVDDLDLFYRVSGPENGPVILLLHGFPTSSHMFRHLIPLLATKYRVYAPDLPGFGFTNVPIERNYIYNFENLTQTLDAYVEHLQLKAFAIYIFDYGAPIGLRLALRRPDAITAIITQNGNAHEEGFGADFWAPLRSYWKSDSVEERKDIESKFLTLETTKWQYEVGSPDPTAIEPEAYYLDHTLLERPGNHDIQMDLLRDYQHNVTLYPQFQQFFMDSRVPVLAIWGKHDPIFVRSGAEAYRGFVRPDAYEVHYVNAGHFALENNQEFYAEKIETFLTKHQDWKK